jgi:hypothetical protein
MKGKGLLFGLNYAYCEKGQLNGCINDVRHVASYLYTTFGSSFPINVYTDDVDRRSTSYNGIIQKLYDLAISSYRDDLDFVWIHYSGHGSHQQDRNGDETDGQDEGLVPSDYHTRGLLLDDFLNKIMEQFNPKTRIVFVTDCCHSGSILDLRYTWNERQLPIIDNKTCRVRSPTILISGCSDAQTSADAFNLLNNGKHIGALTACILKVLYKQPTIIHNVFDFVNAVRRQLGKDGFKQYPCLSSTYDLTKDPSLLPQQRDMAPAPRLYQQVSHTQHQHQHQQQVIYRNTDVKPSYYESQSTYMTSSVPYQQSVQYQYVTYIPIIHGYGVCV